MHPRNCSVLSTKLSKFFFRQYLFSFQNILSKSWLITSRISHVCFGDNPAKTVKMKKTLQVAYLYTQRFAPNAAYMYFFAQLMVQWQSKYAPWLDRMRKWCKTASQMHHCCLIVTSIGLFKVFSHIKGIQ